MVSASKLSRQRHARLRQQEQMANLAEGAKEQAAAAPQGAPPQGPQVISGGGGDFVTTAKVGRPAQGAAPNPDDPNGLLVGGSGGGQFRTTVKTGNSQVVGPGPSAGGPGGMTQTIKLGGLNPNAAMRTEVSTGSSSLHTTVRTGAGQVGQVVQNVQPRAQAPVHAQPTQPVQVRPQPQPQAQSTAADVTVYLTCFDRPGYFRRQLDALRAQTVQPAAIVTMVSPGHVQQDERSLSASGIIMLRSNANLGPWFRFAVALEAPSKYVCILDDDVIPGPRWLEAAIARLELAEANGDLCVAVTGRVFRSDQAADGYAVGPHSPREEELEVDVGQQGWVFRTALLARCQQVPRQGDARTGWAMHLSAALQLQDVLTVVLPYDPHNKVAWGTLEPPASEYSVSSAIEASAAAGQGPNLAAIQAEMYAGYRALGWRPLVVLDAEDKEEAST